MKQQVLENVNFLFWNGDKNVTYNQKNISKKETETLQFSSFLLFTFLSSTQGKKNHQTTVLSSATVIIVQLGS